MASSTADTSSPRGGRRKQAKPQRKNVERDDPSEDIVLTSVAATVGDPERLSPLSHDSNHNHQLPTNRDCLKEGGEDCTSNGLGLHGLVRMHVVKDTRMLLVHKSGKRDDEEEKIQEYLQRSDTAVIFPEPVGHLNDNVPGALPAAKNAITANGSDHSSTTGSEYFIKCPQCHKGYPGFQALKEHVEACHPQQQPSPQPLPQSQPTSPGSPLASSGGPGGYGCPQCNTTFVSKDQLEKHELLHSPNAQVKCKICNKNFANVYRLQRHMISHDESAVLRKFKCPECEKAFKFKHHLKEHIRIHSGEKPFECANCGKRFSHSGSYSSHMTSKKCLVMNLKVSRGGRASSNPLEKTLSHNRSIKRGPIIPLNNNFPPILPKYRDAAAAFLSAVTPRTSYPPAPSLHPFYLAAAPTMHLNPHSNSSINPYKLSPSLSHLLEHLATTPSQQPHQLPQIEEIKMEVDDVEKIQKVQEENIQEQEKNNADERSESPEQRNSAEEGSNSGDLEAVKRILETVNATVTKQLLEANMQKLSSTSSGSGCPSIASAASPNLNGENSGDFQKDLEVLCRFCQKKFVSAIDLHQHERYLCEMQRDLKEGLAAKLEEAVTVKTEEMSLNGGCSGSEEDDCEGRGSNKDIIEEEDEGECITTTDQVSEDGRKVRVRSLIADEQLAVLKGHYSLNPRPKKDELSRIADRIGFPVRVVQVWFQNTRARDRREGRLVHVPYVPLSTIPFPPVVPSTQTSMMSYSTASSPICSTEQPLDLSTKKSQTSLASTPSSSPLRPGSNTHQSDSGEENVAVNLSRKSSRSPTPANMAFRQHLPFSHSYQHSSCSSGGSMADFRRTPSPLSSLTLHNEAMNGMSTSSRLARILAQPPALSHRLVNGNGMNIGLVPINRLIYTGELNSPHSPLPMFPMGITEGMNGRPCSSSPSSDKPSWKQSIADVDCTTDEAEDSLLQDDDGSPNKRHKMSPGLKGGVQGMDQEPEGQFICDQCDKAFSKQSSLARHKYEHSGQRPHKCDVCSKAFKHKHHLTEHKRLHSGEKPFQCSKCLKRFSHSGSYSQHMNHRYSYCKPYRE